MALIHTKAFVEATISFWSCASLDEKGSYHTTAQPRRSEPVGAASAVSTRLAIVNEYIFYLSPPKSPAPPPKKYISFLMTQVHIALVGLHSLPAPKNRRVVPGPHLGPFSHSISVLSIA